MKQKLFFFILIILTASLFPQGHPIGLQEVLDLTLKNDSRISLFTEYAQEKYYAYKSIKAGNLPQVTTSLGYSPSSFFIESQDTGSFAYEYFNHGIPHSFSLSQTLPSGGILDMTVSNTTDFSGITELNTMIEPGTVTRVNSREIRQNPNLSFTYKQPVFINGKIMDFSIIPSKIRRAELAYLSSLVRLQYTKNTSILQSLTLYFHILELKMSLALQRGWLKWEEKKYDFLNRRLELDLVTDTEVWEMRVDIGEREEIILNLEHSLIMAEKSLAFSLGLDDTAGVEYSQTIPSLDFSLSKEELLNKALASHPRILEYIYSSESATLSSLLYESDFFHNPPQFSLSFSLSPHYPDTRDNEEEFIASITDFFSDGSGVNWSLSLILTLPLYDGGKKTAGKNAVAALLEVAEEELQTQIKDTRILCETSFLNNIHLKQKMKLAMDLVDLNKKKVAIEKTKQEYDQVTDLDVEEAELWLREEEHKLWRLKADYFLEMCRLYSYTGMSLAEKLVQ